MTTELFMCSEMQFSMEESLIPRQHHHKMMTPFFNDFCSKGSSFPSLSVLQLAKVVWSEQRCWKMERRNAPHADGFSHLGERCKHHQIPKWMVIFPYFRVGMKRISRTDDDDDDDWPPMCHVNHKHVICCSFMIVSCSFQLNLIQLLFIMHKYHLSLICSICCLVPWEVYLYFPKMEVGPYTSQVLPGLKCFSWAENCINGT